MPRNFFITGMPKSGKTTLIRALIEELKEKGLRVGGFVSPEESHHGTRNAFHVMDIESGKEALLADVSGDGPKVSKYHVDIGSFERIAVPVMKNFDRYDVFVIDEIGRMELKSKKFAELLDDIFESQTPLIATLHGDYVGQYGSYGEVFELTDITRQGVYEEILEKASSAYERKPKAGKPREGKPAPAKTPKKKEEKKAREKPVAEKKKAAEKPLKHEEKAHETGTEKKEEKAQHKKEEPHEKKGFLHRLRELAGF